MTPAMERVIKARVGLLANRPFFGYLGMKLELVEDPKCDTMWTDAKRLGFNPEWVMDKPMSQLEGVFAHEILHCAMGHPFRREGRDPGVWNEAADYVVNAELIDEKFDLPEGALLNPRFNGQYTEQVYHTLMSEKIQQDDGQPEPSGDGDSPSAGGPDFDTRDREGDPSEPGKGSAATGEFRDAPGGDGDEVDQPASEAEMEEQDHDWQTAVAQAATFAKGAGQLSGGLERIASAMLNPKVDWREALQRLLKAKSKDDYSLRRPNRRYVPYGLYVATLDAPRCGPLAFALDYSGSIRQSDIDQFKSEVEDARATLNPELVIVIIFDHGIRQVFEFQAGEPIELPPVRAAGGTSFKHPVLKVNEYEPAPEVLVFLTDLDCSDFAPEPDYPVVWVTTRPGSAPYGEVIEMF